MYIDIINVRKYTQTSYFLKEIYTLPETNSKFAPEHRPFAPKGNESSSNL